MTAYVVQFLVNAGLSGAWLWAGARWLGVRFPVADLVITVVACSSLALLPNYGWLLAMVVLWLILRGVQRADLWPDILVLAGGSAFIWLVVYVSAFVVTA